MSDMTVTEVSAPRRWHVEVDHRADLVFSLRDYFRRLGLTAEVAGPTLIELTTEEDPAELEQWVSNWAEKRETPLHLGEVGERPQTLVALAPRSGSPVLAPCSSARATSRTSNWSTHSPTRRRPAICSGWRSCASS